MNYFLRVLFGAAGMLLALVTFAFAQTGLPEGGHQERIDAALKDISAIYGSPVVRVDQAKAICNDEQYFLKCAEIGKKYDLFDSAREKQVDTLVSELKGSVVDKISQCSDVDCLVKVANALAQKFNKAHPAIARAVELTPQKVKEKQAILDTAKAIGVDFEQCRTMDPDIASTELLRSCARLAKDARIQKYIPEQTREQSSKSDASIALKEGLASGQLQCGDGTLDGCGNFCLNPSASAREQGIAAIPQVCRQIAERFFGSDGVRELESSYTAVQKTYNARSDRGSVVFTTPEGKTITNLGEIGRYLEGAAERGDVPAVEKGTDFMLHKGFITAADRDFAIKMAQQIKEHGAVNFDDCRQHPERCGTVVPVEEREHFSAMSAVEDIMRSEMAKRGVSDPSQCESNPSLGEACMSAARAALPQLEQRVAKAPQIQFIIDDIRQKIRFGDEAGAARGRAEERMQTGAFTVGDQQFRSMADLEAFCRAEPHACLAEATRTGIFSRDVAVERYQDSTEAQYERYSPNERTAPGSQRVPGRIMSTSSTPYPTLDKARALDQFKQWLDNPQGPAPMPVGSQYPYPYVGNPNDTMPYYYQPYQPHYGSSSDPYDPGYQRMCPLQAASPCPAGFYRQESHLTNGCVEYGMCIPLTTKTQPKPIDGPILCPAMPTVSSCPAGEERTISYSSPECGTYYSCRPVSKVDGTVDFPYTFTNGKRVSSLEEARAYCLQYGPGSAAGIAGECQSRLGVVYTDQPKPQSQCERYGSGWRLVDQSGNCFNPEMTEYYMPSGMFQRCSSSPVYGCSTTPIVTPSCPSGEYWNGSMCVRSSSGEQIMQTWNSHGLQSMIRKDADPSRISALKQVCTNVSSSANVWMPSAGTYSSSDFGMPDPEKCNKAAACTTGQYFDGASCVGSGTTATTTWSSQGKTQIWNSYGLQSMIREDADPARISSLKQTCAEVKYSSNIWMPNAGTYSSSDFGMPDPEKCKSASSQVTTSTTTTSIPTTRPQCSDDKDNDGDGWIDLNDSGCTSKEDNTEKYEYPTTTTTATTTTTTTTTNTAVTGTCSDELLGLLGSGCSNLGNAWFSGDRTKYVLPGAHSVQYCVSTWISGCSSGGSTSTTSSTWSSQGKTQIWNSYGLQSTIREDADSSRISSLKEACAQVRYSSNIWMPNAGTYSSSDFGMPDPGKCSKAAACTTSQYFDGASCMESGSTHTSGGSSCASGQYWNGSSCVTTSSSDTPSTSCGSGQYWNGSSCVTSSSSGTASASSCASGQYWNGSSCVTSSTQTSTTDHSSQCAQAGGTWNSASSYCQMPNTSSGSYTSPSSSCGSGLYWNGSSCVASPSAFNAFCPGGYSWNGRYCTNTQNTTVERLLANVFSAPRFLLSLFGR